MSETGPFELIDFLQHMPKVEIHCHLLETVRRDTFLALRDKHQAPLSQGHGLRLTAHAGEFGMPWVNVETALELLEVDRVDHGLHGS